MKAKLKERQFVLRVPEYQAVFFDHLVEAGVYKSMNDAIIKIVDAFIGELRKTVEEAKND